MSCYANFAHIINYGPDVWHATSPSRSCDRENCYVFYVPINKDLVQLYVIIFFNFFSIKVSDFVIRKKWQKIRFLKEVKIRFLFIYLRFVRIFF